MYKNLFVFLLFIVFFSCSLKKKEKNTIIKASELSQLYVYLGEYGEQMEKYILNNKIEKIKFVDERMFLTEKPFEINEQTFISNINQIFPEKDQKGICYINLEAPYLDKLINGEKDKDFQKSLNLFVKVVKVAKKTRPNVKWGVYSVPLTTYWGSKEDFLSKNKALSTLLKEVDVFFPSLYMFYDSNIIGFLKNDSYLESNVTNALELSYDFKKPVFPFIMHRYHPSNSDLAHTLIDLPVWEQYVKKIVKTKYKEKMVDGIVWWSSDSYFYEKEEGKLMKKELNSTKENFIKFNDKQLIERAIIIENIFSNGNK